MGVGCYCKKCLTDEKQNELNQNEPKKNKYENSQSNKENFDNFYKKSEIIINYENDNNNFNRINLFVNEKTLEDFESYSDS